MTREQVLERVRAHLADELAIDPEQIEESGARRRSPAASAEASSVRSP